jgi:hypothetical protein
VVEKRGGDCLSLRTEAGGDRKPDEALFDIKFDTDQMQVGTASTLTMHKSLQ